MAPSCHGDIVIVARWTMKAPAVYQADGFSGFCLMIAGAPKHS
ncbi:hypothetical protein [Asaia astilbis]|nr:hypothetical protein [Asaia astilbis]